MYILGINAYHGDASACLIKDGLILAAAEEERFNRIKHWAGMPVNAIEFCLKYGKIGIHQIDYLAVNRRPMANFVKKAIYMASKRPNLNKIRDRFDNAGKIWNIRETLAKELGVQVKVLKAPLHYVEHHRSHMASAFLVSPFNHATCVSVDGFGDFTSAMWAEGTGGKILVQGEVNFPHSLGLYYLMMTQYLGFMKYGDEYKVMGLAAYGKATEEKKIEKLIHLKSGGKFELDLTYFMHHAEGVSMTWEKGAPEIGKVYTDKIVDLLGPPRHSGEEVLRRHMDIAASMQAVYEKAFFHILNHAYERIRNSNLCLAGGCAFNSLANGKIFENTPFRKIYVQAAAGDAGGALGAAYYVWNHIMEKPRLFQMDNAYLGGDYNNSDIETVISDAREELNRARCEIRRIDKEDKLCEEVASHIEKGSVVGWFQGRMEWGPRALGNRSILCDPRRGDMKEILNLKIKRREEFRPFAPSVLREYMAEWFETECDVPFMTQVYEIKKEKRGVIPAVTHVDGTGRLQTVTMNQNKRYYKLINCFYIKTGVPMLLNTSFNENEPIVCRPIEAMNCFLRTKMDLLVLSNYLIRRTL